jgi:hypothetical protein
MEYVVINGLQVGTIDELKRHMIKEIERLPNHQVLYYARRLGVMKTFNVSKETGSKEVTDHNSK